MPTKIEYCDETWSPVTGCDPDDGGQSEGCAHCWARRMSKRLAGRFGYPADDPFKVTLHPDRLEQPLHWRKPRTVFVCSMGDLWHQDVPDEWINRVFDTIVETPEHTYIVLTKRPERMFEWQCRNGYLPRPNVIGMVTAENQAQADKRIPWLLKTPFARRGVSVEPMLGAVVLPDAHTLGMFHQLRTGHQVVFGSAYGKRAECLNCRQIWQKLRGIDWVICGAETGPPSRPMDLDWARSLRDQSQEAGVPFFFKRDSDGNRTLDGEMWEQYPEETP